MPSVASSERASKAARAMANPESTKAPSVSSPTQYFDMAWGLYTISQYDLAIEGFKDYLKRFPDSPDAPKAQFYIGMSLFNQTPPKYLEAAQSYGLVTSNPAYKGSEYVPQAYYAQGLCFEKLKQLDLARKSWQIVTRDFKDSPYAVMAEAGLKRLGGGGPQ